MKTPRREISREAQRFSMVIFMRDSRRSVKGANSREGAKACDARDLRVFACKLSNGNASLA